MSVDSSGKYLIAPASTIQLFPSFRPGSITSNGTPAKFRLPVGNSRKSIAPWSVQPPLRSPAVSSRKPMFAAFERSSAKQFSGSAGYGLRAARNAAASAASTAASSRSSFSFSASSFFFASSARRRTASKVRAGASAPSGRAVETAISTRSCDGSATGKPARSSAAFHSSRPDGASSGAMRTMSVT